MRPALVEALGDEDAEVFMYAAYALAAIGPGVAAVPGLIRALEGHRGWARTQPRVPWASWVSRRLPPSPRSSACSQGRARRTGSAPCGPSARSAPSPGRRPRCRRGAR